MFYIKVMKINKVPFANIWKIDIIPVPCPKHMELIPKLQVQDHDKKFPGTTQQTVLRFTSNVPILAIMFKA